MSTKLDPANHQIEALSGISKVMPADKLKQFGKLGAIPTGPNDGEVPDVDQHSVEKPNRSTSKPGSSEAKESIFIQAILAKLNANDARMQAGVSDLDDEPDYQRPRGG